MVDTGSGLGTKEKLANDAEVEDWWGYTILEMKETLIILRRRMNEELLQKRFNLLKTSRPTIKSLRPRWQFARQIRREFPKCLRGNGSYSPFGT